ncbi:hypothetical protein [Amycolatopsis anabasis]|uniref:hypothetical protein n=1 Tax=Amycolatopsis anabasis TaxID=1840409 RepID=UPI00131D7E2C|nr:hypothetical protein [Amycolatopsis anabasis]
MAPEPSDVFGLLEPLVRARPDTNPWALHADGTVSYQADFALLEKMLTVPVAEGAGTQSGRLAKAIDAWVAQELRRGGFGEDEVWPRLTAPRVLPREVALLLEKLPRSLQPAVRAHLQRNSAVAPSDARVLGRAYLKQVDVLIWSRGPELLVSTKSMTSSFRKNLANRFEEAYGDAKNLRGRYPLAAMGFLFVLRSTALRERGTVERAVDMLRKLKAESDVYDATCLLIADWSDADPAEVRVLGDAAPEDLGANAFLATLIDSVLARTPVDMHVPVRERREHREIPLDDDPNLLG